MALDKRLIQAICFDIDGTLSDTDDQMIAQLERWLKPLCLFFSHYRIHKFIRRFVMGFEAPANIIFEVLDRLGLDILLAAIMRLISGRGYKKKKAFLMIPGVKKMLADLSTKYPLAIVSARDEKSAMEFLGEFHLEKYFKVIVTSQTCPHTKPFPDPLLYAARAVDINPQNCLLVGDTIADIRTGQRAGAQTAGVLCGFGTEKELNDAGANVILHSTTDLIEILNS